MSFPHLRQEKKTRKRGADVFRGPLPFPIPLSYIYDSTCNDLADTHKFGSFSNPATSCGERSKRSSRREDRTGIQLLLDVPHRYFTFIIEKRRPVKEANSSIP